MLLDELIKAGMSEDDYLSQYPSPALLIEVHGGETQTVPEAEGAGISTEILSPAVIQQELARGATFLSPNTRIEWLQKSDRNPFANLVTVGRAGTNDIVVTQGAISKVHATFSEIAKVWYVQDGKSRNGTFVNSVKLEPGEKKQILDGDKIDFGGEISARFMAPRSTWAFVNQIRPR